MMDPGCADGATLAVAGNADDYRPDGVTVYNFEVADAHTYFVADGRGEDTFVWAHNTCITVNGPAGKARELRALKQIQQQYPGATVQRERLLRNALGDKIIDKISKEGRRIDFAVFRGEKLEALIEVTSPKANKALQLVKERRIRRANNIFVRDKVTRQLVSADHIVTQMLRIL